MNIKDILNKNSYFSDLTETEINQIEKIIFTKKYEKDEILFFEGEPGKGLFIVQSGKVKLIKMTESGKEQILHILKKGNIFSEVVLFDKGEYPATAIAIEKTEVGLIESSKMENLIKKYPNMGIKIFRVMGKRLRMAQEKIRSFGLKNTAGRLAGIIIYLVEEHGKKDGGNIKIELDLTQEDLSNMIGTSRETVSRILSDFEKKGLIATSRQKLIIKDLEGLRIKV